MTLIALSKFLCVFSIFTILISYYQCLLEIIIPIPQKLWGMKETVFNMRMKMLMISGKAKIDDVYLEVKHLHYS